VTSRGGSNAATSWHCLKSIPGSRLRRRAAAAAAASQTTVLAPLGRPAGVNSRLLLRGTAEALPTCHAFPRSSTGCCCSCCCCCCCPHVRFCTQHSHECDMKHVLCAHLHCSVALLCLNMFSMDCPRFCCPVGPKQHSYKAAPVPYCIDTTSAGPTLGMATGLSLERYAQCSLLHCLPVVATDTLSTQQ
jgi:hypothetical protein